MGEQWTDLSICIVMPVPEQVYERLRRGHLFEAEQGICTWSFLRPGADEVTGFLLVISRARSARNLTPKSGKEDEPENGVSRIAKVGL